MSITTVEEWSKFSDGQEYYSKTWHQKGALKGTMLFIHGLGEHINRYNHVFPLIAEMGIKVLAWDQRGFGKTARKSGILGHNGGPVRVMLDIAEVDGRAKVEGIPHFIMGHSMGGGLALKYATSYPKGLSGLIASAPLIEPGSLTKPSAPEYWGVRLISTVLKTFVMNNPVDANQLSRDPTIAKEYNEDPLVHAYGSFETCNIFFLIFIVATVVLMGEDLLSEGYKDIKIPILFTHGDCDTQTSPVASKAFANKIPSMDKTYLSFNGCFHELHNEIAEDRAKVIKSYCDWIKTQLKNK